MLNKLAPKLHEAVWVDRCKMGNCVVLDIFDSRYIGVYGVVVRLNKLVVYVLGLETLLDHVGALNVEGV